jgi:hypothetical protein
MLTCDRIRRHQDSSPVSIIEAIDQLKKGAEIMMHSDVLTRDRIATLEKENKAATERQSRKKSLNIPNTEGQL